MSQTMSNYSAMLKEWYTPDRVAKMILESSPFLAMVPKRPVQGEYVTVPVLYANTAGRSATFSTAVTNKGQTASVQFQVTTATDYALAQVDRKVVMASRSNAGAFLPAARTNIDSAISELRRSLAITSYGSGSGSRGQIASGGGTLTWTLSDRTDAVNFQVGDVLVLDSADGGGTVETDRYTITDLNRSTGVMTVAQTYGSNNSDNDDYIFIQGDYDSVQKGLAAWIPSSAPGATSFFGVDRTADADMLGGVRYSGSGQLRYEALIDGQSEVGMIGGGNPTHAFVNPTDYRALIKEMEAQVTRPKTTTSSVPVRRGSKAMVGFPGIIVQGDMGEIEVFPDRFCPVNTCYMLEMSSWRMAHTGPELVDIVGRDSDEGMLVETSADGYEIRVVSYPQLYTTAPGHNGVITSFGL